MFVSARNFSVHVPVAFSPHARLEDCVPARVQPRYITTQQSPGSSILLTFSKRGKDHMVYVVSHMIYWHIRHT